MSAALGVLALLWLGVDGAPKEAAPQIVYEFRVLEMAGVAWREGVYPSLQPVTRQGSATVWTTTAKVAETLAKKADRVVTAPKVTAVSAAPAHFTTKTSRGIVTHVSRPANVTGDRTRNAAYTAEMERIRDGFAATVTGRRLDQGVLVQLVFDDTQVTAVHPVYLAGFDDSKETGDSKAARAEHVQAKLEVPEVVHNELAGEWLIPKDGVLLASLGAHCVADDTGKAVVRERLVLVQAAAAAPFMVAHLANDGKIVMEPVKAPMPTPSAPSRTLPQGIDADGEAVPMPLPPEAPAPTARPDSDEPVATPQTKHHSRAKGQETSAPKENEGPRDLKIPAAPRAADPAAGKTSFSPEAAPRVDLPRSKPPQSQALKTCPAAAACCDGSLDDLPPLPEPLPEAPVSLAPARGAGNHEHGPVPEPLPESVVRSPSSTKANHAQADPQQQMAALRRAADQLGLGGLIEWDRFRIGGVAQQRADDSEDDQAPPPPVHAYRFQMPLDGVDLEVRLVPRRRGESASRATWRASGAPESVKE